MGTEKVYRISFVNLGQKGSRKIMKFHRQIVILVVPSVSGSPVDQVETRNLYSYRFSKIRLSFSV